MSVFLRGLQEDLQYCVERLVRGLGSNRKGARQGFSVALTELLATFPQVTAAQVLALVDQHLQPVGSAKAEVRIPVFMRILRVMVSIDRLCRPQEERGCLFGQLFALMCLLRSGHLSGKVGPHNPIPCSPTAGGPCMRLPSGWPESAAAAGSPGWQEVLPAAGLLCVPAAGSAPGEQCAVLCMSPGLSLSIAMPCCSCQGRCLALLSLASCRWP